MSEQKDLSEDVIQNNTPTQPQYTSRESSQETNNSSNDEIIQNNKILEDEVNEVLKKMDEIDLEQADENEEPQQESQQQQEQDDDSEEFYTRDLIDMTKTSINFNKSTLFPGSVEEVQITIYLKEEYFADIDPFSTYKLKVVALCNEAKFNDLDEYVFSVRKSQKFQYFEEVFFQLCRKDKAQVKVAVKIPAVLETQDIEGTLSMQLANTRPVYLPITARCEIPQIVCLKELHDQKEGFCMIKIPGKKSTIRMPPIPFKNVSPFNFHLEIELVSAETGMMLYDVVPMSYNVNCAPNTPFFVTLQLKPNLNFKGALPLTETIRKVMILKVRNSSVHFSYPIEVYVYESTNSSNVS